MKIIKANVEEPSYKQEKIVQSLSEIINQRDIQGAIGLNFGCGIGPKK